MRLAVRLFCLMGVLGGFAGTGFAQDAFESDDLDSTMFMSTPVEEQNSVGSADRVEFSSTGDTASAERADLSASRQSAEEASANAARESEARRIDLLEQEILARTSEEAEDVSNENEGEDIDTMEDIRNDAISDLAEISAIDDVTGFLDGLLGGLLGSLL